MVQVPYLRVANVQDGRLDLSEMKEISIRRSEVERYRLQTGDVVLTEGGDFDKLGRGFMWRGELELCVHQNHVFAVRPDRIRLLPEFFAYLAQSAYGKAYFLKVAHKTTNLACINSTKLKAFPVLIPPTVNEQQEIVDILDAIDRKVALHERKRTILEDLFKTLLHKLITGEIRVADLDLSELGARRRRRDCPVRYHLGGFPPTNIDWPRLVPLIGRANAALARYDGLIASIPNAAVLLSPLTTQEAVLSSKIEGTVVTMGEVLKIEAGSIETSVSPSATMRKRSAITEPGSSRRQGIGGNAPCRSTCSENCTRC